MRISPPRVIYLLVLSLVSLCFPLISQAEIGDISAEAILPENQHDPNVSYYDLRVTPGQEQELELELINNGKDEKKVTLAITDAYTTSNGGIDYSIIEEYKKDSSLKVGLAEIATVDPIITVPAKGKARAKIKLKVPETAFNGMILGGVYITLPEEKSEEPETKGVQIRNRLALVLGIKLTENDTPVKADLSYVKAYASQDAGKNMVKVTLQNHEPTKLEDITYDAKIYKKGSKNVLHERKVEEYRFAPNSSFDYFINWEDQAFENGWYQLEMTAESKATGQKWSWEEEFEITAEEAKKLNDSAVDLEKNNTWLYLLIGAGVFLLLVVLVLFVIWRKHKKKQSEEAIRRKKGGKVVRTPKKGRGKKQHPKKRNRIE